ncbi:phosphotransferase family protein [Limosilactobacillus sp.]|uniref:phosphotransferase family protein n=1 Tax=Limosilactobacillus sp. TaxID=2773925 RepID=UPI003EFDEC48
MEEQAQLITKIKHYLTTHGLVERLQLAVPVTVRFLAQGEYNQNFLIGTGSHQYVFRLNYGSQINAKNQIRYEYNALKWLERSGCTPRVCYVDDRKQDFNQGLLIMEFLHGRPLDYRTDMLTAAQIFGQIHQLPVDAAAEGTLIAEKDNILRARVAECQQLLQPVWGSKYVPDHAQHVLERALDTCRQNVDQEAFFKDQQLWRVNNTEVNSHNFIIGKQGWLIDWEKPVISHPVQDISQFLASTTTLWRTDIRLTQETKRAFIDKYLAITGFNRRDFLTALRIYHPYLMLRALSWSAMALDEYGSGEKALQNQEIYHKVQQYMQADFIDQAIKEQVLDEK